ncbi:MAG: YjjW family glycine radical enzyme activase [Trueperaceae bacterium]|nr:YjjW family glycine radical enzyme activase [Trueperaceae bacterium]
MIDGLARRPGAGARGPGADPGATRGLVSGTIPFSSVDGPGNRFVAFLQGCDFDCIACHNPYTIHVCHHCGECVEACESGALTFDGAEVSWDADACTGGDACIRACRFDSTPKARTLSVDELVEAVRGPAPFLSGVTVSGGEATLQADFVRDFFAVLKADARLGRLSCFVDSNGGASAEVWDDLDPVMDGAMIDLKAFDDDVHRRMTGQPNAAVLRSIEHLAARGKLHEVRLLLLPGVNDAPEQLARAAAWLHGVDPGMRVKLIGFRCHGVRPIARDVSEPTAEAMAGYAEVLRSEGLERIVLV